jgi:hypothetical protein
MGRWARPDLDLSYEALEAIIHEASTEWEKELADHALELGQETAIPEMHDRIIAGVARRLGAPLLTRDPLISSAGSVQAIW